MSTLGHLVRNERLKLAATFMNSVGIAFMVTGIAVPLIARGFQIGRGGDGYPPEFLICAALTAGASNWAARFILGGLRE